MAATYQGRIGWSMKRDDEGHRTYMVDYQVITTDTDDGPETVLNSASAPVIGAAYGQGNDQDVSAWCHPEANIRPFYKKEPGNYWIATHKFSTKSPEQGRCQDETIENPLLEPQKVSGSWTRYQKKIEKTIDGKVPKSSSHEPFTNITMDAGHPTVQIEQNVLELELDDFSDKIHHLNDAQMWGLDAKTVKLSNISWSRLVYGVCTFYYVRRFEFEINTKGWIIKDVADAGFKVVAGEWVVDPNDQTNMVWSERAGADFTDPDDYVVNTDRYGGKVPKKVLLDGTGRRLNKDTYPATIDDPHFFNFEVYPTTNLLALGLPTSF